MRLMINPELDIMWLNKFTIQVCDSAGNSFQITDLPIEIKDIYSEIDGIKFLPDILKGLGIDERIHNDINEALLTLIRQRVLINQTSLYQKYENLKQSYVLIKGENNLVFQISHLLAANGVGRIVLENLIKNSQTVSLADVNVFSPRAKDIGKSLSKSIKDSLSIFDTKLDKPDGNKKPDLIIICEELKELEFDELLIKQIPHLYIRKTNDFIHIGPFIVPNNKICLKCQQLAKIKNKLFLFNFNKKRSRPIDNNPALTTLASSLVATSAISYLSKELKNENPIFTNVICELDPAGPGISFKQLKQSQNCDCKWLAA